MFIRKKHYQEIVARLSRLERQQNLFEDRTELNRFDVSDRLFDLERHTENNRKSASKANSRVTRLRHSLILKGIEVNV